MTNHHEQMLAFYKEYFQDRPIVGIEIGTAEGMLTKTLLQFMPNITKLYTIDPYIHVPTSHYEAHHVQEWHDDRKRQAEVALDIYRDRVVLLQMGSDEAVSKTPDEVDFLYVDGDHTEDQVIRDINNYMPKVKDGGIVSGHDFPTLIGPFYRDGLLPRPITLGIDLTWWLIKGKSY